MPALDSPTEFHLNVGLRSALAVLLAIGGLGVLAPSAAAASSGGGDLSPTCGGIVAGILGTSGPDVIEGTSGRDVIWAGRGDDLVNGHGGDDILCGAGGDDTVNGGDGENDIRGGSGDDYLDAGRGRAHMTGDRGDDTLHGSNEPGDYLSAGGGDDELYAHGDGRDPCGYLACEVLEGGRGNDLIDGGGGSLGDMVRILLPTRPMDIDLAAGTSRGQGRDTLVSIEAVQIYDDLESTDDRVRGNNRVNEIDAGGGDDVVRAGGGNDSIVQEVHAAGTDRLFGEGGDDYVGGREGADLLSGGPGDDRLDFLGGTETPTLRGGPGDDELSADTVFTEELPGTIAQLLGGPGTDTLLSPFYRSELRGGTGPDTLRAGSADDFLDGGPGRDAGYAGDGIDTCVRLELSEQCEAPAGAEPGQDPAGRSAPPPAGASSAAPSSVLSVDSTG